MAAASQTAHWTALSGRGVVRVGGPEGRDFLQGLVTADMAAVSPEQAAYGALLTPQGKILFDFFLAEDEQEGGGILLECDRVCVDDLVKRLTFYRLRAKVEIEDVSAARWVSVAWGEEKISLPPTPMSGAVMFTDPRLAEMGFRLISPAENTVASEESDAYHLHRLTLGVAEGSADMEPGSRFPAEMNLDLLNGVNYQKGCFIGQEVVSRMWRRGQARKRVFPVEVSGEMPAPGATVDSAGRAVGVMCSGAGNRSLAVLRVDCLTDEKELTVGATRLTAKRPAWMPAP